MPTSHRFNVLTRIGQFFAFSAMLCACATTQNSHEFRSEQFVGSWSSGVLSNGSGYYLEESFLPDGIYCALSVDVEQSLVEVKNGTWDVYDGMLTINSSFKYPNPRNENETESREIEFVNPGEFGYRFSPLPVVFKVRRIASRDASASGKWCDRHRNDSKK